MPKTKISEFSATPGNNTDIDGINIAEGCPPSGINDAIRELMAQLKDFQSGGAGDSMTAVGTLAAKGTSSSGADLQLYEDTDNGTNYVALKAPPSIASNVTWTLPSADGTNGQALITNGSGTLSFSTISASPGGSTTQVQYNNAGAFAGSANMTFDGTSLTLGGNPTLSAGTANGVAYLNGSKVLTTGSALVFDGSNLGLGVTPSATSGGYKNVQNGNAVVMGSTSDVSAYWNSNATFNSGWKYISNGTSARYEQTALGGHAWFTAPSGTAGNAISFTQAMTLDASGNLGVGATSLGSFRFKAQGTGGILGGNAYFVGLVGDGSASNKGVGLGYDSTSQTGIVYGETASAASNLAFWTYSGSAWGERARITSGGNLLVGTTTNNASGGVIQVSNGITFPATQSASSDANTLDDYEQGTWTPVTKLGTTTQTASNALGAYTKIGNVVYFACQTGDLTKSGTGSLTISLPFTASSTGSLNRSSQALVRWNGINPGGVVIGYIDPGTATVSLQWFTTTGGYGGAVDNTHCSATYQLYGVSGFFYMD